MIILDGGMGQELIARAGRATDLWSVQALLDAPQWVAEVHAAYFAAGAQVATTNTYALLPERLQRKGLGTQLVALTHKACTLAVQARDQHGSGQVAGSLGPQGFSYRPDLAPKAEQAAQVYADLARLHAPFVDLHILETMCSVDEAKGGLMGASVTGKPVWLALSVDDRDGRTLRSGEPVSDILPLIDAYAPQAVLFNCSWPEAISQALPILSSANVPLGAYANGFTEIHQDFNSIDATVDLLARRQDLDPHAYLRFAQQWQAIGAGIIGGCCEVGPAHIQLLSRYLNKEA